MPQLKLSLLKKFKNTNFYLKLLILLNLSFGIFLVPIYLILFKQNLFIFNFVIVVTFIYLILILFILKKILMKVSGDRIGFLNLIRSINIDKKELSGVEIGVFRGEYSKKIYEYFKYLKLNLSLVDQWLVDKDFQDYTQEELDLAYSEVVSYFKDKKNIRIFKETSVNAAKKFSDNSLDFAYIDGNHDYAYVKEDLNTWFKKLKSNGVIFGDDYSRDYGVSKAVSEFAHEKKLIVKFSDNYKQFAMIKN